MRVLPVFVILLLAGCSGSGEEAEIYSTSVDVDQSSLAALLAAVDQVTEDPLDVAHLIEFTNSVDMDDEKQETVVARHNGSETEFFYHVWREQADWVHVYASSESRSLIDDIEAASEPFGRVTSDNE